MEQIISGLSTILRGSSAGCFFNAQKPNFFEHFGLSGCMKKLILGNCEGGRLLQRGLGMKTTEMLVLAVNKVFLSLSLSLSFS